MSTGAPPIPADSARDRPPPGDGIAGWRIGAVTGALPTAVSVRLERDDGATIQILVRQRGEGRCLQATALGDVSYRQVRGLDEREAEAVTRAFAAGLEAGQVPLAAHFPHLAAEASLGDDGARLRLAQALAPAAALLGDGRPEVAHLPAAAAPAELIFDPPGIAAFLAPEIAVDGPGIAGWVLRGVYLPSVARRAAADFGAYVLEFARDGDAQLAQLVLRVDGDESKAFARAGRLSLGLVHQGELDDIPSELASLASWVAALVRLKSSAALAVRVPASMAELRAISHPPRADALEVAAPAAAAPAAGPPPALNLALDPDCGQRCVFCSVKSYVTPTDAGEADLDSVRVQLEQAVQRGVREVRLNGIDPLRHSRALDVVALIRAQGFAALTIFSPGRRLADAAFRAALRQRAPAQLTIYLPLYGRSAAVHDAVTGTPGAHAEVVAALAGLRAELGEAAIRISTIIVPQNVHEIVPLLRWLRGLGLGGRIGAHLPYPMRPTLRDPYVDAAAPESELLARLLTDVQALPAGERDWALGVVSGAFRHPCVRWHAEQASGLPVLGHDVPAAPVPLAGTEYRSAGFVHASGTAGEAEAFAVATVECPHAGACALAPVCPREHYSVYAERFGLSEFTAVPPAALYRATARGQGGGRVWTRVRDVLRPR